MNQSNMPTTYLVDSENVNDVWIELVACMDESDEILVFYTDKSPHMSYEKVIALTQLSNRPIQWVKCLAGNNALDFQLVTELGARVVTQKDRVFVVVSNDNGFDAAVKYWASRGFSVCSMKSAQCKQLAKSKKMNGETAKASETASGSEKAELSDESLIDADEQSYQLPEFIDIIEQLSRMIPIGKLTLFHDALVCMYEQSNADEMYYYVKKHQEELKTLSKNYLSKRKNRVKEYYSMALSCAGSDAS
ncbi:MAG: PIN domain-containing protein, partial [bacterium]|nr:PIN domain-containing protein [bacterium]